MDYYETLAQQKIKMCPLYLTLRLRHSRASVSWYIPAVFINNDVTSQQSWSKAGRLLHLGSDAGACRLTSSTNRDSNNLR